MPSTSAAAPTTSTPLYAGFWRRVVAFSIDEIAIMAAILLILLPFMSNESLATIGAVVALVFMFGYFPVMHSSALQATLGKLLLGVKVTDREGNRIGIGRSLGRLLGMVFVSSVFTLGVGYLLAGVTERRRALHDMIAGTLVVRRDATPAEIVAGGRTLPVTMPLTAGMWAIFGGIIIVAILFNIVSAIVMPN